MGGLRAKVLATQARVLSAYGKYDEAQVAGLDALALAEKLDLHELASDVITTLSNLKKAGPKDALRSALVEAVHRAVDSGAILAELRARYFLGRSYEDWAEWAQAETWFRSAVKAAADAGIPYAPWGFESRWQLAWIKTVDGDWDEALRLTDTSGEQVPPIPSALVESIALVVESGRGEPVAERARALRRFWELEGGVVINSVVAEMADAAHDDDPTKVIAVYQDAVAVLEPDLARVVQRPHPAGRHHDRRRRRLDAPAQRRRAGRPAGARSSGCTARGTPCSTSTPTPPASGDPRAGPG